MKIMMDQNGYAMVVLNSIKVEGSSSTVSVGEAQQSGEEAELTVVGGEDSTATEPTPIDEAGNTENLEGTETEGTNPENSDDANKEAVPENSEGTIGEGALTEGVNEGETGDTTNSDEGISDKMMQESEMSGDMMGNMGMMDEGMSVNAGAAKGSVMSSWLFVIGISAATLALSVVIGLLLAKKRIKKGFDLYED